MECRIGGCLNGVCDPFGTEGICTSDADCKDYACDLQSGACILGGDSYISCTEDCLSKCDYTTDTCVLLGGEGVACNSNDDCAKTYCTNEQTCEKGGDTGIPCSGVPGECALGCTFEGQCMPGGEGGDCATDADCTFEEQEPKCVDEYTCAPSSGDGKPCLGNADCWWDIDVDGAYIPLVEPVGYCDVYGNYGVAGAGMVTLKWPKIDDLTCPPVDPGENTNQTSWHLQISTQGGDDFEEGIIYDSGVVGGTTNSKAMLVKLASTSPTSRCKYKPDGTLGGCAHINYGVSYYWRVHVTEAVKDFGWLNYIDKHAVLGSLTSGCLPYNDETPPNYGYSATADDRDQSPYTYKHVYPHPAPAPAWIISANPAPGTATYFTDMSVCYTENSQYYCSNTTNGLTPTNPPESGRIYCAAASNFDGNPGVDCYSWWYEHPSVAEGMKDYTLGSPPGHTYMVPRTYTSQLQVCDDVGCCMGRQNLSVGTSKGGKIPQWWEISPFQ